MEENNFEMVLLGVIFDPSTRKILIGKRESDPNVPNLNWCFPGGRLKHGESVDKILKQKIKLKTGYDVKNLGTIFVNTSQDKQNIFLVYFLCEVFQGEAQAGDDLTEVKWIAPDELEEYRKRPMNTRLKEYIMSLK